MSIKSEDAIKEVDDRLNSIAVKIYGNTLSNGFMTMSEIFNHAKDTLKIELMKEIPPSILECLTIEIIMERVELCIIHHQSGVGNVKD